MQFTEIETNHVLLFIIIINLFTHLMDYLKIRTKWTIVTVVFVVLIRKSDGDTADMVVSSKVN